MADKARFAAFADFIAATFPPGPVFDIAGGMGRLNEELSQRNFPTLTFDRRVKHLPVPYESRPFTLDEPCSCSLIVGLHPDGATPLIIEYAARHRIPFAIVPCCSNNGMSYRPWRRHLMELAISLGFDVESKDLPLTGRSTVIWGIPGARD